MPYAVKYDGRYLYRSGNAAYSSRKRNLVANINDATTWAKPGFAKLAAHQALTVGVLPARAVIEIVQVNYVEGPVAAKVKRGFNRYGNVTTKDVV